MKKVIMFLILLTITLVPLFSQSLRIDYKCGEINVTTNQLKPHIILVNTGTSDINLSDLTIRYFYEKEGSGGEEFHVDYAVLGDSNVSGSINDGYAEIGFVTNSGVLTAGGSTGEIQLRINKTDWSMYDQSNDYSFDPSKTGFTEWDRISVYDSTGTRIYGIELAGEFDNTPASASMDQYTLTVNISGSGMVSVDPPGQTLYSSSTFTYDEGIIVTLEAITPTPIPCGLDCPQWSFTGWEGDPLTDNTIVMDSDKTVTAVFYLPTGVPTVEPTIGPTPEPSPEVETLVEFHVVDASSGDPVAGASVVVVQFSPGEGASLVTDEFGYFLMWFYDQEVDYVIVSKSGYETLTIPGVPSGTYELERLPIVDGGDVFFVPQHKIQRLLNLDFYYTSIPTEPLLFPPLILGDFSFTNEIHINSGAQKLAAYGLEITFNSSVVIVNTEEGNSGVDAGPDGFVSAVNAETPGTLVISGFDAVGTGPGTNLNTHTIHWLAQTYNGTTDLDIAVNTLVDEDTNTIGMPNGITGQITIETITCVLGDVNGDNNVDIVDALLTAQYFVGWDPSGFSINCGDVNCSGSIDIVDALLIAQYFVGLISSLWC